MARVKATKKAEDETANGNMISAPVSLSGRGKPLVFISHDTRDADLAEAFSNLLLDVSGGLLKSFRSSDKKGTSGIEFGDEWYGAILSRLGDATDVVALLSQQSIDRPWILYEAGLARGKLDTRVIGVALGVPLDRLITGPFGQLQNCADDEDSQTKLVMQLLQQNPDATPREEAIKREVRLFREKVTQILKTRGKHAVLVPENVNEQHSAKLFEEIKSMIRDLPERVENQRPSSQRASIRRSRRLRPMMLEDMVFSSTFSEENPAAIWLVLISTLRDDFPWIYEVGMEVYRALRSPNSLLIRKARDEFRAIVRTTIHHPIFPDVMGGDDKELFFHLQRFDDILDRVLSLAEMRSPERRGAPSRQPEKTEGSQ